MKRLSITIDEWIVTRIDAYRKQNPGVKRSEILRGCIIHGLDILNTKEDTKKDVEHIIGSGISE